MSADSRMVHIQLAKYDSWETHEVEKPALLLWAAMCIILATLCRRRITCAVLHRLLLTLSQSTPFPIPVQWVDEARAGGERGEEMAS